MWVFCSHYQYSSPVLVFFSSVGGWPDLHLYYIIIIYYIIMIYYIIGRLLGGWPDLHLVFDAADDEVGPHIRELCGTEIARFQETARVEIARFQGIVALIGCRWGKESGCFAAEIERSWQRVHS